MSLENTPDELFPDSLSRILRCDACGRTQGCSSDDVALYAKMDWPRCCGEVMALHALALQRGSRPPPIGL
jgi:hypothetical protein